MAANNAPIFSGTPALTSYPIVLTTAAADYTGLSPYNAQVFKAGSNGSFVQRLRFKALGTNTASVARVYITTGAAGHLASLLSTPAAPTGTPSSSGGTLLTGSYYYKIVAVDSTGALSAVGTESAAVSVTGPTGSVALSWTAVSGASSYRIYVGNAAGAENMFFTSSTNSFSHIAMAEASTSGATDGLPTATNNLFYDEIALPATTAIATSTTVTIDLPLNFALPANYEIYVGLGTTVSAGWSCMCVAGNY